MILEHFDTIFAFVVIITSVSLLVTTLTQMASALLGLRGTNLRWGYQNVAGECGSETGEARRDHRRKSVAPSTHLGLYLVSLQAWLGPTLELGEDLR